MDAKNPALILALEKLVQPTTSGDPMRPLRWTWEVSADDFIDAGKGKATPCGIYDANATSAG